QYAGRLAEDELLRLVRGAEGRSGRNPDYVAATQAHLAGLGVHDAVLARLAAALVAGPLG
ncbi:MAG: gamma-glutamylcyclotransferase, partial [Bosea sp. (in: a-proteobacteria)]